MRAEESGSSQSILLDPCPSMWTSTPRALSACSSASAAMKVWAMPVGQEDTPTMRRPSPPPPSTAPAEPVDLEVRHVDERFLAFVDHLGTPNNRSK